MSEIKLSSFQDYIDRAIGITELQSSGDMLNDNVLVDINLQVCTRVRLPISQSLSLSDKTAEVNSILNFLRNALLQGKMQDLYVSDLGICDLLRWNYIGDDTRTNCSEYTPVYGECSPEYKFPRY